MLWLRDSTKKESFVKVTKEEVEDLYVGKRMTMKEIANIYGVKTSCVGNWIKKFGIISRQGRDAQSPINLAKDELFRLYSVEMKSIDNIAKEVGSSETSIRKMLNFYEIEIRARTWKCAGHNKGRKLSENHRKLLSYCARKRIGEKSPRFGKTLSQETKDKISNKLRGRFRGRDNPQWKENATHRFRNTISQTYEYKEWRKAIFKRDNYSCRCCGKVSEGDIQAHHIFPVETHRDLIFDINNGITLCKKCHQSVKGKELLYVDLFFEIIHLSIP